MAVTKVKDSELTFWDREILKNKNWEEHEERNEEQAWSSRLFFHPHEEQLF